MAMSIAKRKRNSAVRRQHDHVQPTARAIEMDSVGRNVMVDSRVDSPEYQSTEYRPKLNYR